MLNPLATRAAQLFSDRALRRILSRRDEALSMAQQLGLRRAAQIAARLLGQEDADAAQIAPWQRGVLGAILETMCAYEDASLPTAGSPEQLEAAVAFTRTMPTSTRQKLYDLLTLIELAPQALGPSRARFTALDGRGRRAHLDLWRDSPIEPMRGGFQGLKSVCMMGYWSRPDAWEGIAYGLDTEGGWRLEDTEDVDEES